MQDTVALVKLSDVRHASNDPIYVSSWYQARYHSVTGSRKRIYGSQTLLLNNYLNSKKSKAIAAEKTCRAALEKPKEDTENNFYRASCLKMSQS